MAEQQRDEQAPIQIFAEHIKRAISSNGASPIPGTPGFNVKNVRRNTNAANNLGILIGAVIVGVAGIGLLIHNVTNGGSWKTVTCEQFLHDSTSQQQAYLNDLQSMWKYDRYSPSASYQTTDGQNLETHSGVAPASILTFQNDCSGTPSGTTLLNIVQNPNNV
jgi:hypothetical protein